jgi:Xaa-Pro aminopeptidase
MYRALMITMTTLLMLVPLKRLFLAVRPLRAKLIEPKMTSCDHYISKSSSDKKMGSKLQKIRALMQLNKINAYIVPSGDAHQSEYICAKDARRSFISEFTGSAGTAVILLDEAFLWTDGRYFLQASNELTSDWKLMKMATEGFPQINEYLLSKLKKDEKVGIDPLLFSFEEIEQMKKEGLEVKSLEENLVDLVWEGKPLFPKGKIEIQELEYSGQDFVEKIEGVRVQIQKNNTWGLVVSALDEIAWLFNLRGTDIDFNPVFLSYAVVTQDETVLYLDTTKLTPELIKHLSSVTLKEYTQVFADLESFSQNYDSKCLVDKKCNLKLVEALGGNVLVKSNPIEIQKAIKNMTEIKGFYDCHQRDAVALCRYFNWLEQTLLKGTEITEAAAADRLELFRSEMPLFKGLSFDTISSTGPNGIQN